MSEKQRLLNVDEAGRYLGCSAWHVRRLVWRGILPSVRIGRLLRLDVRDLDEFIRHQKTQVGLGTSRAEAAGVGE